MFKNQFLRLFNFVLVMLLAVLGLESCHRKTYGQGESQNEVIDRRERAMYGTSPVRYRQQVQPPEVQSDLEETK